jgi:hypothetical protein
MLFAIRKEEDMAREEGVVQTREELAETPAGILAGVMQAVMAGPSGLVLNVAGEECPISGAISDVIVGSAWIMFTVAGRNGRCTLRTQEIKDRDSFWKWINGGGKDSCAARFYTVSGVLEKPVTSAKKNMPFMPRSRYERSQQPMVKSILRRAEELTEED